MKKILIPAFGAIVIVMILLTVTRNISLKKDTGEKQIHTDTELIYNLFPELPATEKIQWCSRASVGIGPTTVWIYAFAFYDNDIGAWFGEEGILSEKNDFYFLPENLAEKDSKWRELEDAGAAFQASIKSGEKIWASVFLNEEGNIIYLEAVWD